MQACDHTSVGVLVWKEGRLLLIDRKRPPYGLAAPAGHVDSHGEEGDPEEVRYEQAAIAELKEETGLNAISLKLVIEGRKDTPCRRGGTWHYWRIYEATADGEVRASEEETRGHVWCDKKELADLVAGRTLATERGEIGIEPVWQEWFGALAPASSYIRVMTSSTPRPDAPEEVLEEIAREYEKSLIIPEEKPSPQWLLMPVGLVGSGKTTVVRPLAERLGLIRISTDEIRELLKRRGYSYEGCRDIADALDQKYLRLGYSIAVDANTGSKFGLEHNEKTRKAFPQVPQIFIRIDPPDEFIIDKLRNYRHTWLFRDSDHAVRTFLGQKKEFTPPDIRFAYTFDPSRNDLSEQIERGAEVLRRIVSSGNG